MALWEKVAKLTSKQKRNHIEKPTVGIVIRRGKKDQKLGKKRREREKTGPKRGPGREVPSHRGGLDKDGLLAIRVEKERVEVSVRGKWVKLIEEKQLPLATVGAKVKGQTSQSGKESQDGLMGQRGRERGIRK